MTIEVVIPVNNQEVKDILIATLPDIGFNGFEEEQDVLKAYADKDSLREKELSTLLKTYDLTYSKSVIKDKNWNEIWERDFSPVVVDEFCSIRADFHATIPSVKHEIVITPKMSFGTGHHATTYLMVQQMQNINFEGKRVADFGTGTGVLAILAEKLGAKEIWAIDNDDWSIENAKENFERNGSKKIHLEKKNSFNTPKKFDIILANINRNVIVDNFEGLISGMEASSELLLSGLLKDDEDQIKRIMVSHNLTHLKTVEKDKWIAMLLSI